MLCVCMCIVQRSQGFVRLAPDLPLPPSFLRNMGITTAAIKILGEGFKNNMGVKMLDLSDNPQIKDEGEWVRPREEGARGLGWLRGGWRLGVE